MDQQPHSTKRTLNGAPKVQSRFQNGTEERAGGAGKPRLIWIRVPHPIRLLLAKGWGEIRAPVSPLSHSGKNLSPAAPTTTSVKLFIFRRP